MTPLLEARDLVKRFPLSGGGTLTAVDGVSFHVMPGETLGIVGESGCGKSTLARLALRLIDPTEGTVRFEDMPLERLSKREMRRRRRDMQLIFQDPFASLDPRMTVSRLIEEPMVIHGVGDRAERARRVRRLLDQVGLPGGAAERYPHEFSGGQRQRISIARAIALGPKLIVADEPVSALDVSIQSQILNLMQDLKAELGLSYVFISHDLAVIEHVSDRVAVMYLGQIVESAPAETLYREPKHPYTQALISAIPEPDPERRRDRMILAGDIPSPEIPPPACRFHTRCPCAIDRCRQEAPMLRPMDAEARHVAACHLA